LQQVQQGQIDEQNFLQNVFYNERDGIVSQLGFLVDDEKDVEMTLEQILLEGKASEGKIEKETANLKKQVMYWKVQSKKKLMRDLKEKQIEFDKEFDSQLDQGRFR
jgi:hypothetical protein